TAETAQPAVSLVSGEVTGDRGDRARLGVDSADDVVTRIGDVNVVGAVDGHSGRLGQLCFAGRTAVPGVARLAVTGEADNVTVGQYLILPVVIAVGDEHVSRRIDRHRPRGVEPGLGRRPARACGSGLPGSGELGNGAGGRVDPADDGVFGVGDVNVP